MSTAVLKFVPLLLALCVPAFAQTANDVVVEKSIKTIDLNADGTFTQVNEVMMRLVTEQGAKGGGQVPLPYSESLQTLEVLEAYTLKPDGTRIDVAADKIFTQAAPIAVSAPTFNDLKVKIIVFPEPMAGGKIYFRVRAQQKTPMFPNQFSYYELIPSHVAIESYVVRVSAPSGFSIRTDSRDVSGGKQLDRDGRSQWEWKYANRFPRATEPFELAGSDFGPYVAISSFTDWSELARAYRERAANKVAVTPEIQTLADDIIRGISDPKAQAAAIYHWVARNVRYVGVFLGLGGFVPRDTADILKTKYGDCKDHTVILESLLRAIGIEATPVLISTVPSYKLPAVPVAGAFNHAISYLPGLDLYLDATASFHGYGSLPNADAGKPVLLVSSGKLAMTPVPGATVDTVHNRIEMTIKPDGTIIGKSYIFTTGDGENGLRRQVASVPVGAKNKAVTRWLGSSEKGEGTYTSTDPNDLAKPFTFSANYEIKDAVNLQSPGAFPLPRGLAFKPVHQGIFTGDLNSPSRKTPFKCGSATLSEEVSLQLPAETRVSALPKDVSHREKTMTFVATYKMEAQKIVINRKFVLERENEYCDPSMWAEVVRMRDVLSRDARAQVLIQ